MIDRHHLAFTRREWAKESHLWELRSHPKMIIPTLRVYHETLHRDETLPPPPKPDQRLAAFCLDVLGDRNRPNCWIDRFDGVNRLIGQLLVEMEVEPSYERANTAYRLARNLTRQVSFLNHEV